jgi:hypothetical protein
LKPKPKENKEFKMKKVLILVLFAFFAQIFAHGVLILVEDNRDGTIYVEAGFSTGGSPASGAYVILRERETGRTIFTGNLSDDGRITIEQPTVPYTVTVRIDDEHSVTRNGPLARNRRGAE